MTSYDDLGIPRKRLGGYIENAKSAVDSALQTIFLKDVLGYAERAQRQYDASRQQLVGRACWILVHKDMRKEFRSDLQMMASAQLNLGIIEGAEAFLRQQSES